MVLVTVLTEINVTDKHLDQTTVMIILLPGLKFCVFERKHCISVSASTGQC